MSTLEFSSVVAPGTPTLTKHGEDLIALRLDKPLQPGPWSVTFDYTASFEPTSTVGAYVQKVAGASYAYTQFEALYARRVFPCIDEPDSKVPWQLTLDVPKGNIAVSNTPVTRESEASGMKRFEFAKTKPLPSYLVAFGVGPFDVLEAGKTKSGIPVRIVTLKGRGPDAAYAQQTTAKVLDILEGYFGRPYPYEKLDMLTIPLTVGFGAMENAGLITHAENIILFDPKTLSQGQRHAYISVVGHEMAHQWFGDLVTMQWWDDLWLNEGFATWLETKVTGTFEPSWRSDQENYDTRSYALSADSIVTARRIRQPIDDVDDIEAAFDGITYSKGAAVMSMFESYVGANVFQRGVRDYIKAHEYGNATSADFVSAISAASGKDLTAAFASFIDQVGAPEVTTKLVCDKSGSRVELAQQRYVAPGSPDVPAQIWQIPVCVAYEAKGKRASACTMLVDKTGSLALPGKSCPRWVMPNVDGQSYYHVRYTQQQAQTLRDEAWESLTALERRAVFDDVHTMVYARDQRLPLALALSFVPKLLAKPDRFTVGDALGVPRSVQRKVLPEHAEKYAYYMRTTFGPGAAKLGFVAGPKESLDDESTRVSLLWAAAWSGRDPELVAKAQELVKDWRDLPASTRGFVLTVATDADADLAAKLMREIKTETDRARRSEMYSALASQRDAKRYEAALELMFEKGVDIREAMRLLWGTSTEQTRAVAERYLRVNEAKLLAAMPKDSSTGISGDFAAILAGSCDKTKRDEAKAYATEHYGKLAGGQQMIDQVFEEMDQCIANRELIAPQLRAWLGGIRLPKSAKAK